MPEGAARCPKCQAAQRDTECPHCRATAGCSQDKELRYVCDVCGGPRVPNLDGTKRSGRENKALSRAEVARRGRSVARGGMVLTAVAAPTLAVFSVFLLLVFGLHVTTALAAIVLTAPFILGFFVAMTHAKARTAEIVPALDEAWLAAATDLARALGRPMTSEDLVQRMGLEESDAEQLVAMVDVNAESGASLAPGRVRIDASATSVMNDEARIELEAKAEAEAAVAEAEGEARRDATAKR